VVASRFDDVVEQLHEPLFVVVVPQRGDLVCEDLWSV